MIVSSVLKNLDNMLEASYSHSLFKKYIVLELRRLFTGRLSRLFAGSFTARTIGSFIAFLPRAIEPVFDFFLNTYRGSAFLDAIGRAVENSRWIK